MIGWGDLQATNQQTPNYTWSMLILQSIKMKSSHSQNLPRKETQSKKKLDCVRDFLPRWAVAGIVKVSAI